MKKMLYIYAMDYHSAIIKKEILSFVTTRMDFEGIMLSEQEEIRKPSSTINAKK